MQSVIKNKILKLRSSGKTYSEINSILHLNIPKSTLSCLCKNIKLTTKQQERINVISATNLAKARTELLQSRAEERKKYFAKLYLKNSNLKNIINSEGVAKLLLSCLYLAEGAKTKKGSMMFGNSDPKIIKFFLSLLRKAYDVDEDKFRCTLQCRADQNVKKLEKYWSIITNIPLNKFYHAQIDKRSLGKKTIKSEYKGVCRIDYFSAEIFHELTVIGDVITK